MTDTARFWDKIAVRYSKKPVSDEAAYQKKLAVTREHFGPETRVLEFGCGTGSTAILHAPHVQHILATDISPKMIEIAKEKARADNVENVSFEVASIETLDAPDASFDVVLGRHNLATSVGEVIDVVGIVVHPDYNPYTLDSDIAESCSAAVSTS